jgi:dihydrofolate reductase
VEVAPEGETLFPAIDPAVWRVVAEPEVPLTAKDSAAFHIRVYERKEMPSH